MAEASPKAAKRQPTRVYADGCFDLMHFGHANALRQAKALGDILVVGIHNDEDIEKNKGPPVLTQEERYKLVKAVKWVDEVVTDAPYTFNLDFLEQNNCDFVVHGDDITTNADGEDAYHIAKKSGRYKEYQRTQGVSTTDIVGRMLLMTRTHHQQDDGDAKLSTSKLSASDSPYTGTSQLLANSKRIVQFSTQREPKDTDVIGYMPGAFDLLHTGHVAALEAARQQCDYLIVGLHTDRTVNRNHGSNYPIMNLQERTLSILACRYVDDVVIGAPEAITEELLDYFKITKVFHGSTGVLKPSGADPYQVAIDRGIFVHVESHSDLTTEIIVDRIIKNRLNFAQRNAKKTQREVDRILRGEV
ncbi:uncharacterized protein MONBRDRAFT_20281 [Monosiga brevicollis MX1]|uniref:ethanolamine-phosphate cytidylyltransferase n=1 Tax=Monosiga brevicollis TaxID=81824 RepID=A9UVC2_MONBE|nr:uncharacterized protein MONBRDRAFT_20281 [Monosiga brevicollis MX1]EDQ91057.1 predicted protein [Monosiga brevicollis MX1]|eukprot:XP_001744354.1 hypothetical protein [Monosiga brevicollis MX1]